MTSKQVDEEIQMQDLQIKVAFLEDSLTKLSDEFFAQQKELNQLSLTVGALIDKLAKSQDSESQGEFEIEERPPHY